MSPDSEFYRRLKEQEAERKRQAKIIATNEADRRAWVDQMAVQREIEREEKAIREQQAIEFLTASGAEPMLKEYARLMGMRNISRKSERKHLASTTFYVSRNESINGTPVRGGTAHGWTETGWRLPYSLGWEDDYLFVGWTYEDNGRLARLTGNTKREAGVVIEMTPFGEMIILGAAVNRLPDSQWRNSDLMRTAMEQALQAPFQLIKYTKSGTSISEYRESSS